MNNSRDNSREFQNSPFSTFSPGKIRKFVVTRTRRRRKSTRERMNEQEEGGKERNIDDSPFSWVDSMANMFKASN